MIAKLNFNRHRQARIWLGELPSLMPISKHNETSYKIDNFQIDSSNEKENVCHFSNEAKLFEMDIFERNSSSLLTSNPGLNQKQKAAVEMIIPSAGRALYGLLGAEFVSDRSNKLLVKVAVSEAVSENVEPEIDWSLASSIDKVCAGLPVEYADSVFDGVVHAGEILGSGVLFFNCAAHGEIGSSPQMFRQLALKVVRLIAAASVKESLSEKELISLLATDENERFLAQVPIKNYVLN